MKKLRLFGKVIVLMILLLLGEGIALMESSARQIIKQHSIAEPPAVGVASYYSYECADNPMANGRPFDPEKRTCASWFYKFNTVLIVKSLDTGRMTEVIVTDRGPNKRLVRQGRIIDLSKRAFQDICRLQKGLTRVEIQVKAPGSSAKPQNED